MKFNFLGTGLLCLCMAACQTVEKGKDISALSDEEIRHLADSLAQVYIIVDSHVDLPYRLQAENFKPEGDYLHIPVSTTKGDFDYERAKRGGLDAPFMSIYIPSSYQQRADMGKALADTLINMVETIASAIPDKFALARTPADIESNTED